MKLGIVANIEELGKVPEGDKINYMKFLADVFRQRYQFIMFNWRDLRPNLKLRKYLIVNNKGFFLRTKRVKLNKVCNLLFVKNLGKINLEQERFLKFLNTLRKFKGKIVNPLNTMKNNLSKQYLIYYQKKGFPVIPTIEVKKNSTLKELKNMDFSFNKFYKEKLKDLIIKPKIFGEMGNSVKRLGEFKSEREFREYFEKNKPVLVQPFIEEIKKYGENSFVFFGNEFVHALNKFTGDFKINFTKGIKYKKHKPSKKELELCKKIIKGWLDKFYYMRIDLIPYNGEILISEIEVLNPAFYIENVLSFKDNFVIKLEKLFFKIINENG